MLIPFWLFYNLVFFLILSVLLLLRTALATYNSTDGYFAFAYEDKNGSFNRERGTLDTKQQYKTKRWKKQLMLAQYAANEYSYAVGKSTRYTLGIQDSIINNYDADEDDDLSLSKAPREESNTDGSNSSSLKSSSSMSKTTFDAKDKALSLPRPSISTSPPLSPVFVPSVDYSTLKLYLSKRPRPLDEAKNQCSSINSSILDLDSARLEDQLMPTIKRMMYKRGVTSVWIRYRGKMHVLNIQRQSISLSTGSSSSSRSSASLTSNSSLMSFTSIPSTNRSPSNSDNSIENERILLVPVSEIDVDPAELHVVFCTCKEQILDGESIHVKKDLKGHKVIEKRLDSCIVM